MCGRNKLNTIYKKISPVLLTIGLIMLPVITFAQGDLPCDDSDPYAAACPLDGWVWIIAAVAIVFGVLQITKVKKNAA